MNEKDCILPQCIGIMSMSIQLCFYVRGGNIMATKSFTTEFKINKKASQKLVNALQKSRRVDHKIDKKVETIKDHEKINNIMASFLGK